MINVKNTILSSDNAALKFVASGTGSIIAPATSSIAQTTHTIPHGMGSAEKLFWSVSAINTTYALVTTIPWASPDGRVAIDAFVDDTNLYIKATSQTAGGSQDASYFDYQYNIIIA